MLFSTLSRSASRTIPSSTNPQKRRFVNWLTQYPDRVMEMKKIQQAGGVCQGEANPTWLKQPGDYAHVAVGAALVGYGMVLSSIGLYRLATGKGKKD